MTRRLLDQNLAPRLVDRVAAEFPGSLHVQDLDLQAATDQIADSIIGAAESIGRLMDDPSVQIVQMASGVEPVA